MAKLVKEYNLGLISKDYSPKDLTDTIKQFNIQNINEFKFNTDKAAKILNYKKESTKLINIVNFNR